MRSAGRRERMQWSCSTVLARILRVTWGRFVQNRCFEETEKLAILIASQTIGLATRVELIKVELN